MNSRIAFGLASAAALTAVATSCSRDLTDLELAPFPSQAEVLVDGFAEGVTFEAFAGSRTDAVDIDPVERFEGSSSLRVTVPAPGDPGGGYAGGAFTTVVPRDLTGYNALTFWARASIPASLDVAGLGNDNTGTSRYTAEATGLPLSTSWTRYVLPIPLASRLDRERGLFFFAEGPEGDRGYTLWFDAMEFATVDGLSAPRPVMDTRTVVGEVGQTFAVSGTRATWTVDGSDVTMAFSPAYFDYQSSAPEVATVDDDGEITIVGAGTAVISASLGSVAAEGAVTVAVARPPSEPAPTPTRDAEDVISLFSDAYDDVAVDTWSAVWDDADVEDVTIDGNATKKYSALAFAGVELTSAPVDATGMTHFTMDIWTPDPTAEPSAFRVKLVDFGADGMFGGGDDVEHEVTLTASTTPALATESWVTLDLPLSQFTGLTTRGAVAQLILSGDPSTVYVDNVYFYDAGGTGPSEPSEPAPTPTRDPASVISLFSDAYDDVAVDTWSAVWDDAGLEDVAIDGNAAKKYTGLNFAGIEATSAPVDASGMTHFTMDVWTPDPTADPAAFRIKLVDFGADGAFGGGDDVEHEVTLTASTTPALATGAWVTLDLPLSEFTGLTTRGAVAQLILSGDPNTVYVDNVYFYDAEGGTPTEPAGPAPTPTRDPATVISLFSDTYDDVVVDTWSATWDDANVEDVTIDGNAAKKYTALTFAGIEFTSAPVDASGMTHFTVDVWTPDPTADPAAFRIKLVDFGADGAFGGGDDVEHEVAVGALTDPALATGRWVTLDIPLSQFTGLTTRGAVAQLILSGDPDTVWIDNVYFHE